ncbi:TPA: ead/Ea22-like family protein [Klebsiella pneumoniae]
MTTDITELAQSLKAAAIDAKELAIIARYSKGRAAAEKFYALANPNNVIALVEALELKEEQRANWSQMAQKLGEDLDAAEKRIAELEPFHTAYMEWSDKTAWVQTDKRFDVLKPWGKHRADVLKEYIQHLESRTVKLPQRLQPGADGYDDWYVHSDDDGEYLKVDDVLAMLAAAGIKVEAE